MDISRDIGGCINVHSVHKWCIGGGMGGAI